jgi:hypothetical protein
MAATEQDLDYVHRVQSGLAATTGVIPMIQIVACDLQSCPTEPIQAAIQEFGPDLVVVQLGDSAAHYEQSEYTERLQSVLDIVMGGGRRIILTGVWYWPHLEAWHASVAAQNGISFVPIFDLNYPPNHQHLTCAQDDLIRTHPGDRGHAAIANRILGEWFSVTYPMPVRTYIPAIALGRR